MKSGFTVLYPAIFIFLSTTMTIAGAGMPVSSFKNAQNKEFSAATAERPLSNATIAAFEQTGSHFNGSATTTGNPPSPVPEPATLFLIGTGLIAIAGIGRKKLLNKKDRNRM
jgi:hypothetical protein